MKIYKLVAIYYSAQLFILVISGASVIRQLGIFDITRLLLVASWFVDLAFVVLMTLSIRKWVFPSYLFWPVLLFCVAPLMGVLNKQFNHTFVTDIVVYTTFFLKILIFHQLFSVSHYANQFAAFLVKFCKWAVFVGVLTVGSMYVLSFAGHEFYFSATPNITYSYALTVISGNTLYSYLVFLLGLATGKRMIIIGLFVIFVLTFRRFSLRWKEFLFLSVVVFLGFSYISINAIESIPGVSKVQLLLNFEFSYDKLMELDRHRMSEILGIIHVLEWYDYVFGKGFGFRYFWFDNPELQAAGVTHTNAHFTPLGIISKFGVIGFISISTMFVTVIWTAFKIRLTRPLAYMNYVFLVSMIVQSMFAYILFNNPLIPLVIAFVMSSKQRQLESKYREHPVRGLDVKN